MTTKELEKLTKNELILLVTMLQSDLGKVKEKQTVKSKAGVYMGATTGKIRHYYSSMLDRMKREGESNE